ncbi:MAG: HAMP domain-containing histidine kinase [Candidatus Cloacimonetes bacterium]|nr:HAMP domain-containing histidine kinase [Candidatus Cloacimonadota bacterium]
MSIFLQLATVVYALYLFRITGRKIGWIFITIAFIFMILRRFYSINRIYVGEAATVSWQNELNGLFISLFMFIGTVTIKTYFQSILHSRKKLQDSEQTLRKINASKDRLFSIIAHDLKNPFNTLVNFSGLLKDNYDNLNGEKVRDFIIRINRAAKRAYDLLDNLLHWSRSQLGMLELHLEQIDLQKIILENILLLSSSANEKNIIIDNQISEPLDAYADGNMIAVVIRNLLQNGLKFTPENGRITISAETRENRVIVYISDSGIGIEADRIPHLFAVDTNYTTPGTNRESGTGLGLILCQEFIEQNRGRIWVESSPGKGSTFAFELPINPVQEK